MSAAVIILRRKKFIRRFAEQCATSLDRAIPFEDVGMRRSWIFDQMVSRGVFVRAGNDRFYMNQEAARTFLEAQRRRARIGGGILLVAFVIVVVVLLGLGR